MNRPRTGFYKVKKKKQKNIVKKIHTHPSKSVHSIIRKANSTQKVKKKNTCNEINLLCRKEMNLVLVHFIFNQIIASSFMMLDV